MYDPILSNILGIPLPSEEEELERRRRRRAEMESLGLIVPSDDFTGPQSEANAYLTNDIPTTGKPPTSPRPVMPARIAPTPTQPAPTPVTPPLGIVGDTSKLPSVDLFGRPVAPRQPAPPTKQLPSVDLFGRPVPSNVPPGAEGIIGPKAPTPTQPISSILGGKTPSAAKTPPPASAPKDGVLTLTNGVTLNPIGKNRFKGSDNKTYRQQGQAFIDEQQLLPPGQITDTKKNVYKRVGDGPQGTKGIYSFNNQRFVLTGKNSIVPEVEFNAQQASNPELYRANLKPISIDVRQVTGKAPNMLTFADTQKVKNRIRQDLEKQGVTISDKQADMMMSIGMSPNGMLTISPEGLAGFKGRQVAKSMRYQPVLERLYAQGANLKDLEEETLNDVGLTQAKIDEWLRSPVAAGLAQTRQQNINAVAGLKNNYAKQFNAARNAPVVEPKFTPTNEVLPNGTPKKRLAFSDNPMEALSVFRGMDKKIQDRAMEAIAQADKGFIDKGQRDERLLELRTLGRTRQQLAKVIPAWRAANDGATAWVKSFWKEKEHQEKNWTDEQLLDGENEVFLQYAAAKAQQFGSLDNWIQKTESAKRDWAEKGTLRRAVDHLAIGGIELGALGLDVIAGGLMLIDTVNPLMLTGRAQDYILGKTLGYKGDAHQTMQKYFGVSNAIYDHQGRTAGQIVRDADFYKKYHEYGDDWSWVTIGANVGAFLIPQALVAKAGAAAGWSAKAMQMTARGTSWATGTTMMIPGQYASLRQAGYSDREAKDIAVTLSVPLGATEMFGIGGIVPKYIKRLSAIESMGGKAATDLAMDIVRNGGQRSIIGKLFKASPYHFGKEFTEETLQETLQSATEGSLMKMLTQPDPETGELREGWAALLFAFGEFPDELVDSVPHAMAGGVFGGGIGLTMGTYQDYQVASQGHMAALQKQFQTWARTKAKYNNPIGDDGQEIELSEQDRQELDLLYRQAQMPVWDKYAKAMGLMRRAKSAPATEREALIREATALIDQANAARVFFEQRQANANIQQRRAAGEESVQAVTEDDFAITPGGIVATINGLGRVEEVRDDGTAVVMLRADLDGKGQTRVYDVQELAPTQPSETITRVRAEEDAQYTGRGVELLEERINQVETELSLISEPDENGALSPMDGQEDNFLKLSDELEELKTQQELTQRFRRPMQSILQDEFERALQEGAFNRKEARAQSAAYRRLEAATNGRIVESKAGGAFTVKGIRLDDLNRPYYAVEEATGEEVNGENALYFADAVWPEGSDALPQEQLDAMGEAMDNALTLADAVEAPLSPRVTYEAGTPVNTPRGPAVVLQDNGDEVIVGFDRGGKLGMQTMPYSRSQVTIAQDEAEVEQDRAYFMTPAEKQALVEQEIQGAIQDEFGFTPDEAGLIFDEYNRMGEWQINPQTGQWTLKTPALWNQQLMQKALSKALARTGQGTDQAENLDQEIDILTGEETETQETPPVEEGTYYDEDAIEIARQAGIELPWDQLLADRIRDGKVKQRFRLQIKVTEDGGLIITFLQSTADSQSGEMSAWLPAVNSEHVKLAEILAALEANGMWQPQDAELHQDSVETMEDNQSKNGVGVVRIAFSARNNVLSIEVQGAMGAKQQFFYVPSSDQDTRLDQEIDILTGDEQVSEPTTPVTPPAAQQAPASADGETIGYAPSFDNDGIVPSGFVERSEEEGTSMFRIVKRSDDSLIVVPILERQIVKNKLTNAPERILGPVFEGDTDAVGMAKAFKDGTAKILAYPIVEQTGDGLRIVQKGRVQTQTPTTETVATTQTTPAGEVTAEQAPTILAEETTTEQANDPIDILEAGADVLKGIVNKVPNTHLGKQIRAQLNTLIKTDRPVAALGAISKLEEFLDPKQAERMNMTPEEWTAFAAQIQAGIDQIQSALAQMGYEIMPETMRGQAYSDDMKVIAEFKNDPNVPEGQEVITKVKAPGITKDGEMIQAPEIVVSIGNKKTATEEWELAPAKTTSTQTNKAAARQSTATTTPSKIKETPDITIVSEEDDVIIVENPNPVHEDEKTQVYPKPTGQRTFTNKREGPKGKKSKIVDGAVFVYIGENPAFKGTEWELVGKVKVDGRTHAIMRNPEGQIWTEDVANTDGLIPSTTFTGYFVKPSPLYGSKPIKDMEEVKKRFPIGSFASSGKAPQQDLAFVVIGYKQDAKGIKLIAARDFYTGPTIAEHYAHEAAHVVDPTPFTSPNTEEWNAYKELMETFPVGSTAVFREKDDLVEGEVVAWSPLFTRHPFVAIQDSKGEHHVPGINPIKEERYGRRSVSLYKSKKEATQGEQAQTQQIKDLFAEFEKQFPVNSVVESESWGEQLGIVEYVTAVEIYDGMPTFTVEAILVNQDGQLRSNTILSRYSARHTIDEIRETLEEEAEGFGEVTGKLKAITSELKSGTSVLFPVRDEKGKWTKTGTATVVKVVEHPDSGKRAVYLKDSKAKGKVNSIVTDSAEQTVILPLDEVATNEKELAEARKLAERREAERRAAREVQREKEEQDDLARERVQRTFPPQERLVVKVSEDLDFTIKVAQDPNTGKWYASTGRLTNEYPFDSREEAIEAEKNGYLEELQEEYNETGHSDLYVSPEAYEAVEAWTPPPFEESPILSLPESIEDADGIPIWMNVALLQDQDGDWGFAIETRLGSVEEYFEDTTREEALEQAKEWMADEAPLYDLDSRGENKLVDLINNWKPDLDAAPVVQEVSQQPAAEQAPQTLAEQKQEETQPIETVTEEVQGKTQTVYAGDIKTQIDRRVIPADQLITSDEAGYPAELQPRDTTRKASAAFVASIAADLDTDRLGDDNFAGNGRPIVVPVMVDGKLRYAVIAGNHRVGAIRQRYGRGDNQAYADFAAQSAPETAEGVDNPVYVGVITKPDRIDLKAFAQAANAPQQRTMSVAEQAVQDAKGLSADILGKLVVSEQGDLGTTANSRFIQDFLRMVGEERASAYRTATGGLSQDGMRAMRAAIFAAAYADTQEGLSLLEQVFESEDSNIKRITAAMLVNAAAFAQLKADIAKGNRFDGLDISTDLAAMAVKFADLRNQDMPVNEFLQQGSLFGAETTPLQALILQMLEKNKNSAKALNAILQNYLGAVDALGSPNQMSMFGNAENRGAISILQGVIEDNEGNKESNQQALFGTEFGPQDSQTDQGTVETEEAGTPEETLVTLTIPRPKGVRGNLEIRALKDKKTGKWSAHWEYHLGKDSSKKRRGGTPAEYETKEDALGIAAKELAGLMAMYSRESSDVRTALDQWITDNAAAGVIASKERVNDIQDQKLEEEYAERKKAEQEEETFAQAARRLFNRLPQGEQDSVYADFDYLGPEGMAKLAAYIVEFPGFAQALSEAGQPYKPEVKSLPFIQALHADYADKAAAYLAEQAGETTETADTQQEVNENNLNDAVDTLEESEINTLEEVYGEERGSEGFMAKLRDDLVAFAEKGAKGVRVKIRKIIAKVAAAVLAVGMILTNTGIGQATRVQIPVPSNTTVQAVYTEAKANFGDVVPSAAVATVAQWASQTNQTKGKPSIIVDKANGVAYVMDANSKLIGASPVVTGLQAGRDSYRPGEMAGVKGLDDFTPDKRLTAAGQAEMTPTVNAAEVEEGLYRSPVLLGYLISDERIGTNTIDAVHTPFSWDRVTRLDSATADDNFASYGCVNIGIDFFKQVIEPTFITNKKLGTTTGTIFILPAAEPLEKYFPEAVAGGYTPTQIEEYIVVDGEGRAATLEMIASPKDMTADRRTLPISRQTGRPIKDSGKYEFQMADLRNLQEQGELERGKKPVVAPPTAQEPEEDKPLMAVTEPYPTMQPTGLVEPMTRLVTSGAEDREGKKFAKKPNTKDVPENLGILDQALKAHPNPEKSEEAWNDFWAYLTKSARVPLPPLRLIQQLKKKLPFGDILKKLTPGQIKDADEGFVVAKRFAELYKSGQAPPMITGKILMWGMLSRGLGTFEQESLFLRATQGIEPFIAQALKGTFDPAKFAAWKEKVAPKQEKGIPNAKSGWAGNGAAHNLNAFGNNTLKQMSKKTASGKTGLQLFHEWLSDPSLTGPQIRRLFHATFEATGFDNKVLSFILLVTGRPDVLILDRVGFRNMYEDGTAYATNIYDGVTHRIFEYKGKEIGRLYKEEGETDAEYKAAVVAARKDFAAELGVDVEQIEEVVQKNPPTGVQSLGENLGGVALYEALERAVGRRIKDIYAALGRSKDASLGRFHWDSWVGYSSQEAAHGTISGIYKEAVGEAAPYAGVFSKEGRFDTYMYGFEFSLNPKGKPIYRYTNSKGEAYLFTQEQQTAFIEAIKKPVNGVVPSGFKVSENETGPWYENKQVNRNALDGLIEKFGRKEGGAPAAADVQQTTADGKQSRKKSDKPLTALRTQEAEEKVKQLRSQPLTGAVAQKAKAALTKVGIELNIEAGAVLEALARKTFDMKAGFEALFLQPGNVAKLIKAVKATAEGMRKKGMPSAAAALDEIAKVMEQGVDRGTLILYVFDNKISHEVLHKIRYLTANGAAIINRYNNFAELLKTSHNGENLVEKAYNTFLNRVHGGKAWADLSLSEKATIWEEAFTESATGQFAKLGLTPDQATALIRADLKAFTEKNGTQILTDIQEFIDERFKRELVSEGDTGQVPGVPAVDTGGVPGGTEGGQDGTEESGPGKRTQSPKYAERILDTGLVTYETEGMTETDRKGRALLQSVGEQELINRIAWQTGDIAAAMAGLYHLQRQYVTRAEKYKEEGKEAEYQTTLEELAKLSERIISAQIQTGRAVNMAKMLYVLPRQQALIVATRIKKRFTGNENAELTPAEVKAFTEAADAVEKAEKELKEVTDRIQRRKQGREPSGERIQRRSTTRTVSEGPRGTTVTIRTRLNDRLQQGFEQNIEEVRDFLSSTDQPLTALADVTDEAVDKPLTALSNDTYVPVEHRKAFGAVAAKLMQDGFDADLDYDADKFVAELTEMFGPRVEQFADDVVRLGFETLAQARIDATRDALVARIGEAEAEAELARRKEEQRRRSVGKNALRKLATQAKNRTGAAADIDKLNADPVASDIAKVLSVNPSIDLPTLVDRVANEYGLDEVEAARQVFVAKDLVQGVKRNALIEKYRQKGDPAPEVSADVELREKKEAAKERAKRNRDVKRMLQEHDSYVEQQAEIADKTDDPVVQYIANMLLEAKRPGAETLTIARLLKDINKEFGIGLEAARNKAREAQAVVDQIVKERREAKALAQGKSLEDLELQKQKRIALRQAQQRLSNMLRSHNKPRTLVKKFNMFLRGTFVFNVVTQLFNFIQGFTMVGIQAYTDLISSALRLITNKSNLFPEHVAPMVNFKTAWLTYGYMFTNNRQIAEGIVSEYPDEWHRMELGIIADIPIEDTADLDRRGILSIAHRHADKLPKLTELLAKWSFAREQEIQVRTAVVLGTLDQFARNKGTTLKQAIEDHSTGALFTEAEIREAVSRAHRTTFASPIEGKAGAVFRDLYDQIDNWLPVFLNPIVYLRFTYTTTKLIANGFLGGVFDLKKLGGGGYSPTSVSHSVAAWSSVLLASAIMESFGGDDDDWYTIYLNGPDNPPIDIRRWYPMSVSFFIAHNIRLASQGKPIMSLGDAVQAFASIEWDLYARSAGVEAIKAAYAAAFERAETPDADEKLWKASAKLLGSVMGGMLRPLSPIKRFVNAFSDEEAKLRNYREDAQSEFIGEIAKSVPGLATLYEAPELIDPVTLKPVTEQLPLARVFGFNHIHQMFTRPKLTKAEALAQQMFPANFTTPLKDLDKIEAARVRSEIKQAVRSGKITETRAETLVDYHVSKGALTEEQGKRLIGDLKLTYLEEIIKYRVSLGDKNHVKRLKELLREASPREKRLIMDILANKKIP